LDRTIAAVSFVAHRECRAQMFASSIRSWYVGMAFLTRSLRPCVPMRCDARHRSVRLVQAVDLIDWLTPGNWRCRASPPPPGNPVNRRQNARPTPSPLLHQRLEILRRSARRRHLELRKPHDPGYLFEPIEKLSRPMTSSDCRTVTGTSDDRNSEFHARFSVFGAPSWGV
jgi:hypothetical protein